MAIERAEWNMIRELVMSLIPPKTLTFGKVVKRDEVKRLVWLTEFGETAIPLVDFERSFQYYDTQLVNDPTLVFPVRSKLVKKEDPAQQNPNLLTKIVVPRVGQTAIVVTPWGNQRFPVCIGVIRSTGHWTEE